MKNKKELTLIIVGALVLIGIVIGVSYAYLSTGGKQDLANTFRSRCLNISLNSETSSINLTNTYPISDIEGLNSTPYTFTITNTCSTSTNYQVNLESLNSTSNTLAGAYIKVALSHNSMGNTVRMLGNTSNTTTTLTGAYQANKLYTGSLNANETKTFNLRLWIDYDATKEQAANKTYTSKINVIANPDITLDNTPEVEYTINGNTLTGTLKGNVTSTKYCTSEKNICTPNIAVTPVNNTFTIELDRSKEQIVCTSLNNAAPVVTDKLEILKPITIPDILAGLTKETRTDFSTVLTDNTTGTIYTAEDDDGTSYYYAGAVDNNWVKFGGFYWRIIRINGDGTIRMIYNGPTTDQTGLSTMINNGTTYKFSHKDAQWNSYNDNAYVGYMYGTPGSTTYESTHANITNSNIKQIIDEWYNTNLNKTGIKEYIDTNEGFCGDRATTYGTGAGTTITNYRTYNRLQTNKAPSLKCINSNDLYTVSSSNKGNKALTYPVGLITADEVAYAGGSVGAGNLNFYLYTNQSYWTMSPSYFDGNYADVFKVGDNGYFQTGSGVHSLKGARPVINLKADTTFKAGTDGTTLNPYEVI